MPDCIPSSWKSLLIVIMALAMQLTIWGCDPEGGIPYTNESLYGCYAMNNEILISCGLTGSVNLLKSTGHPSRVKFHTAAPIVSLSMNFALITTIMTLKYTSWSFIQTVLH